MRWGFEVVRLMEMDGVFIGRMDVLVKMGSVDLDGLWVWECVELLASECSLVEGA